MNPIIEQKIIDARTEVLRDSMPPERKGGSGGSGIVIIRYRTN